MLRINVVVFVLCALSSWQVTNSRTSTFWKINTECGDNKITGYDPVEVENIGPMSLTNKNRDEVFYIIASTIMIDGDGGAAGGVANAHWIRHSAISAALPKIPHNIELTQNINAHNATHGDNTMDANGLATDESLNCGKPVNFTYYDYLIGVGQRFNHPMVPEPEVAYLFLKNKDETSYKNFDITALEKRLKRAKRNKRSVQLYNQIGNYWRIVGDACQAIECFRRALAMSPTNADVLLNLARVLYNLQYLDDAIHLTRRSLEMQPPGRSAWQQYFTLGEIFKAYGHFQESILHLRHALELYPQHEPILKALRDVENSPSSTLHAYTVVIIIALVVAVLFVICNASGSGGCSSSHSSGISSSHLNSVSSSSSASAAASNSSSLDAAGESKTQRHFNRAMAMRSLKGIQSSRSYRHRKY